MKPIVLFKNYYEFLQFFANENIGNEIEINFENLWEYVSSDSCRINAIIRDTGFSKDECYKLIEEDIINGSPVWDFFVLSDWMKNMLKLDLEKSEQEAIKKQKEFEKQYLCFSCLNFHEHHSSFSVARRCLSEDMKNKHRFERNWFKLKKKCKYFEKRNIKE